MPQYYKNDNKKSENNKDISDLIRKKIYIYISMIQRIRDCGKCL